MRIDLRQNVYNIWKYNHFEKKGIKKPNYIIY